jgi:site-specific DNA recombinase
MVPGKELSDGASAWKRESRRPAWDTPLERLRSGVSQGVVGRNTDRLSRSLWDLETLIDLGDKGYRVLSVTGEYNLSNADHRFILRIKTAQAAKESDDDRPMVDDALVARERRAIKEAADALLTGVSQSQIARDWNNAGLRTVAGQKWIAITVRETMRRPTLAGRIEHDGRLEGRFPGEPILDEATFCQLRALFAGRRRGGQVGLNYLASSIARCGECHQPLYGRMNGTRADGTDRHTCFCNVSVFRGAAGADPRVTVASTPADPVSRPSN